MFQSDIARLLSEAALARRECLALRSKAKRLDAAQETPLCALAAQQLKQKARLAYEKAVAKLDEAQELIAEVHACGNRMTYCEFTYVCERKRGHEWSHRDGDAVWQDGDD